MHYKQGACYTQGVHYIKKTWAVRVPVFQIILRVVCQWEVCYFFNLDTFLPQSWNLSHNFVLENLALNN